METQKPNNPSAFPCADTLGNGERFTPLQEGMTLRDYYASNSDVSKQMKDMSTRDCEELLGKPYPKEDIELQLLYSFELESKMQFMKADAMLKQREL